MIRTNFEISQIEAWILLEIGSHMNLELISNIVKYMLETNFESIPMDTWIYQSQSNSN
jgi:hypothetical protein